MSNSIKIEQNVVIHPDRDSAVQTALTGSTVYSLPRWTAKRDMVDVMLMIMDEDGPVPMVNMRPVKRTRNAADQFYDEHHAEYEAMGRPQYDQVDRVRRHNNACPKMYDELHKRRSLARTAHASSSQNLTGKFDPNCPKCIKRKKRIEEERKKSKRLCKKCREQRSQKESKNKLSRVAKQKIPKLRKQQTRCRSFSMTSKPCIVCSNKGFQCHLAAETKSVSTCKSCDNLLSVAQDITTPNVSVLKDNINPEKIVLKSKSSHKKRVGKKPASVKTDANSGHPDTETGQSVSSYNSFMSTEHEPMVE